jgi:multiple sugar transport system substrate-binding protein
MPDVFDTTMASVSDRVNSSSDVVLTAEAIGNTYNDLTQRIVADVAAGTQSDLALVPLNRIPNFVEQGIVQPIGDVLEAQGVTIDDLDQEAVSLAQVDGELYGVPFALSAPMLYYNADLFTAAGLDPDNPPATWDDVRAAAEALTAAGSGGIVYQWDQDQWVFQSQVGSAGGTMLNDDGTKAAFADKDGVRALTFWTDLAADGLFPVLTSVPNPDDRNAFTTGQVGMWVGSSAFAASVESKVDFEVRTTQFPSEDGSATPLAAGGSAIVLLSTDPAVQARAASVLAAFAAPETSSFLVQNSGYLPINATARDSDELLKGFLADQPLRQPAIDEIGRLTPWTSYAGNRSVEITELITKELEAALKGVTSPKDALKEAASATDELIGVE